MVVGLEALVCSAWNAPLKLNSVLGPPTAVDSAERRDRSGHMRVCRRMRGLDGGSTPGNKHAHIGGKPYTLYCRPLVPCI